MINRLIMLTAQRTNWIQINPLGIEKETYGQGLITQLPYVTGKTKSLTSDERWEGLGLINGGAAHSIRLVFWGESNGPVTHRNI